MEEKVEGPTFFFPAVDGGGGGGWGGWVGKWESSSTNRPQGEAPPSGSIP